MLRGRPEESLRRIPLLALALAACTRGDPDAAAGDTLTIALPSDVRDLLPVLYASTTEGNVVSALQMPLLEPSFDCDLKFKPGLAREWRFSEDGRTLTVDLRGDVTWPDGTPVTADDVRFAWTLVADPKVKSPRADSLGRLQGGKGPRVVSPTTLEWTFAAAYDRTAMLAVVAGVLPVPRHLLDSPTVDRASLRGHPLDVQSPVGTGPWKLTSWEQGARIVLEPNERFVGPDEIRPKLDRVVLQSLPDYRGRVAALEAGSVDVVEGLAVEDADRLVAADPTLQLRRRGWRAVEYVAWNGVDPEDWKRRAAGSPGARPAEANPHRLFADREVRRALGTALDTQGLIGSLLTSARTGEVYGRPAVGTITPALCRVHNDGIVPLPFAPEDARARLAELGWADTNNDGWLDKDGQPFRFTLLTNAAWPRRTRAAELIEAQLAAIGVDVVVEPLAPVTFYERLKARDFDAALSSWSASLYVDPSPIWGEDSEYNFTTYRNPRVAELLARGLSETNADAANAVWKDLQAEIYADQPYAFLYWTDEIVGVDGRFQGATVDVLGGWRDLHAWRVGDVPPSAGP